MNSFIVVDAGGKTYLCDIKRDTMFHDISFYILLSYAAILSGRKHHNLWLIKSVPAGQLVGAAYPGLK